VDHDCSLGDYVSISPNSGIGGNVSIGDHSFIGMGSNIIHNINIGNNNVIGSSSLVIRDIGSFILGYGTPFKEIKKINDNEKYL
jgi:carbonic anhydrase/acetyltransferase-like protein (isoleucine patch superfamily)